MRKLLIGLTLLSSMTSFASERVIIEKDKVIDIKKGQSHIQYDSHAAGKLGISYDIKILETYEDGSLKVLRTRKDSRYFIETSNYNLLTTNPDLCVKRDSGKLVCIGDRVLYARRECSIDSVFIAPRKTFWKKRTYREVMIRCGSNGRPIPFRIERLVLAN